MKTWIIIVIVGMIGLVGAGLAVSFNFEKVEIEPSVTPSSMKGNITFNCGKTPMSVAVSEPDNHIEEDDFMREVKKVCSEKVSNIKDWNGRYFKENEYGVRSFDENVLKRSNCMEVNKTYSHERDECYVIDPLESGLL